MYMYITLYIYTTAMTASDLVGILEHAQENGSKKQDNSLILQGVRSPPAG